MTRLEERAVRQVIARLRGNAEKGPRCSPEIDAMLKDARMSSYLESWVIGSLVSLLPESRDLRLAVSLSS